MRSIKAVLVEILLRGVNHIVDRDGAPLSWRASAVAQSGRRIHLAGLSEAIREVWQNRVM